MQRTIAIILGVAVATGVVWWISTSNQEEVAPQTQTQSPPSPNEATTPDAATGEILSGETTVQIQDFTFAPSIIKVKKGTKVTWINQDSVEHNVVSDSDSPQKGLNGPLLSRGESYSFTFDTVGTYTYHCTPHPDMQAAVEVVE